MSIISDDYAVYLPAVNTQYAETLIKPITDYRPFPTSFTLEDMVFWKGNSKLWYHPHFLHSVGQYSVGATPDNAVTRRGRTDGILFGDSGGYQIGKGKLTGIDSLKAGMTADEACSEWRDAYEVRRWILGWLETHCNYAMTIDMPLWATLPKFSESPFHQCSHAQLTELTVENLKFIDSHRQGRTKWLNVIQGSDIPTILKWWDKVKWFNSSGYAISSNAGRHSGLVGYLRPLLQMRDENAFDSKKDRSWIHVLGVSTAPWAVMFTAIQKALQATVNSSLRISFDSATPFQEGAIRESYYSIPSFGADKTNWVISKNPVPHGRLHVGSSQPLPFNSPIANQLTYGYLNVRDEKGIYTERQFDALSLAFISNHNVWVLLQTFKEANDLVFSTNRNRVPAIISDCVDLIEHVFTVENWADELHKERKLLNQFKG